MGERMPLTRGYMTLAIAGLLWAGCAVDPPPIVIHEEKPLTVWLKFDPANGTGHSHPTSVSREQMTAVLRGLGVRGRDTITGFGLLGETDSVPAFTSAEVSTLAPLLTEALAKASPKDMVTFYLITRDQQRDELVTSGGLFVRNRHLYVILANARTSKYAPQYENPSTIDTRDQPLLPIARYRFTTVFTPREAWIPNTAVRGKDGYDRYLDESKLVVIDLDRIAPVTNIGRPPTVSWP